MERLRKGDEAAGVDQRRLTDADKADIAEVRNYYEAKLAEQDILYHSRLSRIADLQERETLEQEFRRERERLASDREAKIEKLRRGVRP